MRSSRIHPSAGILAALWCALASPQVHSRTPDTSAAGRRAAAEWAWPKDAFREFLRESRTLEDSLHYRQGERALSEGDIDSALAYHLAIGIPAPGAFRDEVLAQRERIFARIWRSGDASLARAGDRPGTETETPRPGFAWGAGAGHARRLVRTGPSFPFGGDGSGAETREWRSSAFARATWPVRLGGQSVELRLSAEAGRTVQAAEYASTLEAESTDGPLANLSLSLSSGLARSREWGAYRYQGISAAKAWYFASADAFAEAGFSRQWDGSWRRLSDAAWAQAGRGFSLAGWGNIQVSLRAEASAAESRSDGFALPVRYKGEGPETPSGELSLGFKAPLSRFSLSPGLSYGFPMPGGIQALAEAGYSLDLFPEYAWNRIPWPDSLDPDTGDLAGLAMDREDGRYYAAVLTEEDGESRFRYGSRPLETGKRRRVDNRASLGFSLGKELPRGYFLSADLSAEAGWTNLPDSAPADFLPWQWSIGLGIRRAAPW